MEPQETFPVQFEQVTVPEIDTKDFLPDTVGINTTECLLESNVDNKGLVKAEILTKNEINTNIPTELEEYDPSQPFPFSDRCCICTKDIRPANIKRNKREHAFNKNLVTRVKREHQKLAIDAIMKNRTPKNEIVLHRIQGVDLEAVNAGWHQKCRMHLKDRPLTGRLEHPDVDQAMNEVYLYMEENNKNEFTFPELRKVITGNVPANHTMKRRLKKKFGKRITFTNANCYGLIVRIDSDLKNIYRRKKKVVRKKASKKIIENSGTDVLLEGDNQMMHTGNVDQDDYDDRHSNELECEDKSGGMSQNTPEKYAAVKNYQESEYIKPKTYCSVCLSVDRKLKVLGDEEEMYRKICADIVPTVHPKLLLVCWECKAMLRNARRFYERAQSAQTMMTCITQGRPFKSLSSLSVTSAKTSLPVTNKHGKHKIKPKISKTDNRDHEIRKNKSRKCKRDVKYENEDLGEFEFEYDGPIGLVKNIVDDNDDDKPLAKSKSELTTVKSANKDENADMNVDLNDQDGSKTSIVPKIENESLASEDIAHETFNDDFDNYDDDYENEKLETSKMNDRVNNTVGPSLETTNKACKRLSKVSRYEKIQKGIHYIQTVQDITDKIVYEPIERGDVEYWLEKERNSTYFRIQSSKCERCVCGVPDGEDHQKLYHSPQNPFVCEICSRTFALDSERASHSERHYYTLRCVFCGFRCYDQRHMHHHIHDQHRAAIRCLQCDALFRNVVIFKEHFKDIHRNCICDYCGKRFPHKMNVERHILRHHATKHECSICHRNYKSRQGLVHHRKIKHIIDRSEAAYCVQCDKQFDNCLIYRKHLYSTRKHAHEYKKKPPEKPKQLVQCPKCPKMYACQRSCREHYELVHANRVTFQCHVCKMAFARKNNLKAHVTRLHEGLKLPKNKYCEICGRGFATNKILTNHIRTHTGERPHACPHCDAKFAQKAAMTSHVKNIHLKKQQFEIPMDFSTL